MFNNIETVIAIMIAITIAIKPGQPKIDTNLLPSDIIIPASSTPNVTAEILVLKSRFKKLAASVPLSLVVGFLRI